MNRVSIIVCCRKAGDSVELQQSLSENPGLQHLEDTSSDYDIYEAVNAKTMADGYNEGIANTESAVLVFTHSDVRLWAGNRLWWAMVDRACSPHTGFIGLAGAGSVPGRMWTGGWWQNNADLRGAVAHQSDGKMYMSTFGPYGPAIVMDGVFLACHRAVIEQIGPWDPQFGWHFYDIDMTFRANQAGLVNWVVPLPILHYSVGNMGAEWETSRRKFITKHKGSL